MNGGAGTGTVGHTASGPEEDHVTDATDDVTDGVTEDVADGFAPVPGVPAEPAPSLEATDPAVLVAMSQPLRAAIVSELIPSPATAAELAERLDVPPTRLYYHLDLLEGHGVIRVVATRKVRGVEERRYRAVARDYRLAPEVMERARSEPAILDEVVEAMFAGVRSELSGVARRLDEVGPDRTILARTRLTLDVDRRREFIRRLRELIEEYGEDDGVEPIGVLIAAYPMEH